MGSVTHQSWSEIQEMLVTSQGAAGVLNLDFISGNHVN